MAKRFTDTNKWEKAWFRKLEPKMKCVWLFLCDRCDHAGIWEVDDDAFCYFIGENISKDEILKKIGDKIEFIEDNKLIIKGFIDFQYGKLNPLNRVHQSVIQRLEKIAPYKPLISPLEGAKDKDKEKDILCIKKGEYEGKTKNILRNNIETLCATYPNKEEIKSGTELFVKEIHDAIMLSNLEKAIKNYVSTCESRDQDFIKKLSSFHKVWKEWINKPKWIETRSERMMRECNEQLLIERKKMEEQNAIKN